MADDVAGLPVYPRQWEADVVVADGGTVRLRPIRPDDADALVAFHGRLSQRTRYLRYFSAYPRIPERDLLRFVTVDFVTRMAFIVLHRGEIIGVGRYEADPDKPTEAEVAFVVADADQGRGIGSVLLEHLAAAARERSITTFSAEVLAENSRMVRVFLDAGYQASRSLDHGVVHLEFSIVDTAPPEAVAREREQRAEARSIARLLAPRSVAVIGASRDPAKIGNAVLRNLLLGGYTGTILPIHPEASAVEDVAAYPSVLDVPGDVDLAVIAVPAGAVGDVVAQCARKGVHGLVVISGGFGERTDNRAAGLAAQRELVGAAREQGMRVVGPNCLGIANNASDVRLNASLAPLVPPLGRVGFFCQSGALGVAVLGEAVRRDLGLSTFVSAGNRADVSGNDLLQYWEGDPATDIVLLYLESFGNPRKFARLARRTGRSKPIVAVKSGRGAVVSGLVGTSVDVPESSVQTLFEASGVIRVGTLDEMFDVGLLLAAQPLPEGDRLAVVGNSAALGVLVSEAAGAERLTVTRSTDTGVNATPEEFGAALTEALADPDVDALIAVFVPPLMRTSGDEYAEVLRSAAAGTGKPVLSTFLGFDGVPTALQAPSDDLPGKGSVPSYPSPERAVRALGRAVRHATWRRRDPGVVPALPGVDAEPARRLVEHVLRTCADGRWLSGAEVETVLGAFGVHPVTAREVLGPWEAQSVAVTLGRPVALRSCTTVQLHLGDEHALADAWAELGLAEGDRAVVQAMAPRGIDTVFGVQDDRSFGALVSFGIGGLATELLGDRAYSAVPLTTSDAVDLIDGPRAAAMLHGYGGAPAVDVAALQDLALRLSTLSDELPEVAQVQIGTAVAAASGAFPLWAEIRVAPPAARSDGPRRMRGL
ncbi:MAG: GNAT family N-acetyltransferase [Jatrophihabitans sp.]